MAYLCGLSARIGGIIPDKKGKEAVINTDVPCGTHFTGRIGSAAEIYKITVVGRGIFGIFGVVIFTVKNFVFYISFC